LPRGQKAKPDGDPTFEWLWNKRFLPTRVWNIATETNIKCTFARHVLPVMGQRKLSELEKFELDMLVKRLAESYSKTIVHQVRTYTKAALEGAIDQGILDRTPHARSSGRRLAPPASAFSPSTGSPGCSTRWTRVTG
jgi:hypothetical protein